MTPEQNEMLQKLKEETGFKEDVCRILLEQCQWDELQVWKRIGKAVVKTQQERAEYQRTGKLI